VVNANGTQVRELLPNVRSSYIDSYAWAPDGKEIAFAAVSYRGELDIYMIIADGTGQTNLTSTRDSIEDELSWSSDGKRIAFTRGDVGDVHGDQGVYVMDADGTGQKRIANNASSPSFAPWDGE
jgi:Tol biopolymer transport system component